MIKWLFYQEDIRAINVNVLNIKTSKYVKKKLTKLKEDMNPVYAILTPLSQ